MGRSPRASSGSAGANEPVVRTPVLGIASLKRASLPDRLPVGTGSTHAVRTPRRPCQTSLIDCPGDSHVLPRDCTALTQANATGILGHHGTGGHGHHDTRHTMGGVMINARG